MLKSMYNRQNHAFMQLLRSRRQSMRLRQQDLAQALGLDQATVSKVESGARRLDLFQLRNWLSALDLNFSDLAGELDRYLPPQMAPVTRRSASSGDGLTNCDTPGEGRCDDHA